MGKDFKDYRRSKLLIEKTLINEKKLNQLSILTENDTLYFLHIPKTAGTTLINILEKYFDNNTILRRQLIQELFEDMPYDFSKYRFVKGHFGYGFYKLFPKKLIYITMLREPKKVLISLLKVNRYNTFKRKGKKIPLSKMILKMKLNYLQDDDRDFISNLNFQCRWLTFDYDVSSLKKEYVKQQKNMDSSYKNKKKFGAIGTYYNAKKGVPTDEKELLKMAKKNLLECRFFGIVEKYQESLFLLHYIFGWRPIKDESRLNVTEKIKDVNDKLSDDAENRIKIMTKLDNELYQFGKTIFESRYSEMIHELEKKYYESKYKNMTKHDVVFDMLEKHYNEQYNVRHKKVSSINYDFGNALDGRGWHRREEYRVFEKKGEIGDATQNEFLCQYL